MRLPNRLLSLMLLFCASVVLMPGISIASHSQNFSLADSGEKPKSVSNYRSLAASKGLTSGPESDLAYLSPLERGIYAEMNLARTNPRQYADYLEEYRKLFKGKMLYLPKRLPLVTNEGTKGLDEAEAFLRGAAALPPFSPSEAMSLASKERLDDMAKTGVKGHRGSDGSMPDKRLNRYGKWIRSVGEAIAYDIGDAREVIFTFIVDDGVRDRGHRKSLFSKDYTVVGVAADESFKPNSSCVIDFAGAFENKVLTKDKK